MSNKTERLEALKEIISSQELGTQEELVKALSKKGYKLTQATLSRILKKMKVAKAATPDGNYVYVLPNETMYRRVTRNSHAGEMPLTSGFLSLNFSGNMGVIRTKPGYASSIAYNIDNSDVADVLGTIAGDDTIFMVIKDGADHEEVKNELGFIIPEVK